MTPVKSTNIKAVGYDSATKTMTVDFKAGPSWRYFDVDPSYHDGILKADSPGGYFHKHIRGMKGEAVPKEK